MWIWTCQSCRCVDLGEVRRDGHQALEVCHWGGGRSRPHRAIHRLTGWFRGLNSAFDHIKIFVWPWMCLLNFNMCLYSEIISSILNATKISLDLTGQTNPNDMCVLVRYWSHPHNFLFFVVIIVLLFCVFLCLKPLHFQHGKSYEMGYL